MVNILLGVTIGVVLVLGVYAVIVGFRLREIDARLDNHEEHIAALKVVNNNDWRTQVLS
jgi:uncharacterized membrane protein